MSGNRIRNGLIATSLIVGGCSTASNPETFFNGDALLPQEVNLDKTPEAIFCTNVDTFEDCLDESNRLMVLNSVVREVVQLGDVTPELRLAARISEDRKFLEHEGVDMQSLGRAALIDLHESVTSFDITDPIKNPIKTPQGGSTLDMQAVNMRLGLNLGSFTEKKYEIDAALTIHNELVEKCTEDNKFTPEMREESVAIYNLMQKCAKDNTEAYYLNGAFFGRQASGVQMAAKQYFDKDVWELDQVESIFIITQLQSPSNTDFTSTSSRGISYENGNALYRYTTIVDDLYEVGEIETIEHRDWLKDQYDGIVADRVIDGVLVPKRLIPYVPIAKNIDTEPARSIGAEHAAVAASYEAAEHIGIERDELSTRGYVVELNIDLEAQTVAFDEVLQVNDNSQGYEANMIAARADGSIEAYVGGENLEESAVDMVSGRFGGGSGINAGSGVKMLGTVDALRKGYHADTVIRAESFVDFPGLTFEDGTPYSVRTRSGCEELGFVAPPCEADFIDFLAVSSNTVFAETMKQGGSAPSYGAERLLELDEKLGGEINSPATPAIIVGPEGTSLRALTEEFGSVLMNQGQHVKLGLVSKIYTSNGVVVWDRSVDGDQYGEKVVEKEIALETTQMFRAPIEFSYGTAYKVVQLPDNKAAGKTGTATNNAALTFVGSVSDNETGGITSAWSYRFRDSNNRVEGASSKKVGQSWGRFIIKAGYSDDDSTLLGDPSIANR